MRKSETFEDQAIVLGKIEHRFFGQAAKRQAFGTRFLLMQKSLDNYLNPSCEL